MRDSVRFKITVGVWVSVIPPGNYLRQKVSAFLPRLGVCPSVFLSICASVCLRARPPVRLCAVCRISQKVGDGFAPNFVRRLRECQVGSDSLLHANPPEVGVAVAVKYRRKVNLIIGCIGHMVRLPKHYPERVCQGFVLIVG